MTSGLMLYLYRTDKSYFNNCAAANLEEPQRQQKYWIITFIWTVNGIIVHFVIDEINIFKWTCSRSGNNAGLWLELCRAYWLFSFHLAEHLHKHFLRLFSGNKLLIPVGSQLLQPSPYLFLKQVKRTLRFPVVSRFLWIHSTVGSRDVSAQTSAWFNYPPQASAVSHGCARLGPFISLVIPVVFTHVRQRGGSCHIFIFVAFPCSFCSNMAMYVYVGRRQARQCCEPWVILCR